MRASAVFTVPAGVFVEAAQSAALFGTSPGVWTRTFDSAFHRLKEYAAGSFVTNRSLVNVTARPSGELALTITPRTKAKVAMIDRERGCPRGATSRPHAAAMAARRTRAVGASSGPSNASGASAPAAAPARSTA